MRAGTPDRASRGFTLIEVILALVLLAAGLTIIIGLLSSAGTQTIRDRDREFALLAGRQIFAALEAEETDLEPRNEELPLYQLLDEMKSAQPGEYSAADEERMRQFTAHIVCEGVKVPGFDVDVLRKILLTISWSPAPLDSVELVYFVPAAPAREE